MSPNNSVFVPSTSSPVASCSNVFADSMAGTSINQNSGPNDSTTKSTTYLEKKGNELGEPHHYKNPDQKF